MTNTNAGTHIGKYASFVGKFRSNAGSMVKKKAINNIATEYESPCFGLQLRMTSRLVSRYYNEAFKSTLLEVTEFSLLAVLSRNPLQTETELAVSLGLERTSLVRNAKRLMRKGYIEPNERIGRAVRYILTKSGRATFKAALPQWETAQRRLKEALGSDASADLKRVLAVTRTTINSLE